LGASSRTSDARSFRGATAAAAVSVSVAVAVSVAVSMRLPAFRACAPIRLKPLATASAASGCRSTETWW
jgi:hypothetical protein